MKEHGDGEDGDREEEQDTRDRDTHSDENDGPTRDKSEAARGSIWTHGNIRVEVNVSE